MTLELDRWADDGGLVPSEVCQCCGASRCDCEGPIRALVDGPRCLLCVLGAEVASWYGRKHRREVPARCES